MTPIIAIGAIAAGLFLICLALRINAIFMFVAFGTGQLLVQYIGSDAALAVSGFVKGPQSTTFATIFLLVVPILLCILFLRRSLPSSGILLQAVPLAFIAASFALLILKALPTGFQQTFFATQIGHSVNQVQDLVVVGSGVTTLLLILAIGRPRHEDGGKHSKHR